MPLPLLAARGWMLRSLSERWGRIFQAYLPGLSCLQERGDVITPDPTERPLPLLNAGSGSHGSNI